MASNAYAYKPTIRDDLAALLLRGAKRGGTRDNLVRGIMGSGGAGPAGAGLPLIDFTPLGIPLAAQVAGRMLGAGAKDKSALGVAGGLTAAALTVLPGGKAVTKAAKAAAKAAEKKAASFAVKKAAKSGIPLPGRVYTPEEQAVYDVFGSKHVAEAKRQKQVEAASDLAVSRKLLDPNASRAKTDPLVYRKMQEEQGQQAVLDAAQAGGHLRRTEAGYTGAPRTVTGPQGLGAMRSGMDRSTAEAAQAIALADPENLGRWYQNARAGQAAINEPYMLDRALEQHGVYSAGVSPESEIGFALKHHNSRMLGQPSMAFRKAPAETLDLAVRRGEPAVLGKKTGEYAPKQDPRASALGLFGTNDFRRAQDFGYTTPTGTPWKAAVGDTMHPFMDAETALAVDRANARDLGGRADWTGELMQEVPWVYGKGQDLYRRGMTARFKGEPIEGMKAALLEANKTPADYIPKHMMSATYEYAPGASVGHVPAYSAMSPSERAAYGAQGRWDIESPEVSLADTGRLSGMGAGVGQGNRDVLYGALGMRQGPTIPSSGAYKNAEGNWEFNDLNIARPLVDYPTGGGGGYIDPLTERTVSAVERFRALADAQEAGAANLPNTGASLGGKNAVLLDTGAARAKAGAQPTSEQLKGIIDALGEDASRFGVTATNRGTLVFPFDRNMDPKLAAKVLKKASPRFKAAMPDAKLAKGKATSVYSPALLKETASGGFAPTTPFSGEATSAVLSDFAALPREVPLKLSESPDVRSRFAAKIKRDEALGGAREDIQNTRRFFRDADWPKAVELMRKGVPVATALATLGYSLSAMAAPSKKRD